MQAARQFVFAPGEAAGKPVPVRITYQYKFLFKPPPAPAPPTPQRKSPTVPVEGQVLRAGDRQPLGGLSVIVDDNTAATSTNAAGRFHLDAPVGAHVLHVVGPEIAKSDFKVTLSAGKSLATVWYVLGRERYASTVRGQRVVVETVEQTLSGEELRHIPGTQGDTLKAVQNLPGVARAPFGGGLLVVWGSAPQDTRTYVDGVYIPTLYHFGGLRSTVNSEMVAALQFLPGGYGVEHGRGLGGVIEIETRNPRADGYHGFVQLDLIDGSLMLEGPITKNLSFAVGARRSWIDAFLPHLHDQRLPALAGLLRLPGASCAGRASARDDLDLFVFGCDDVIKLVAKGSPDPTLSAQFDSHTYYHRVLARWLHRFASRATLTVTPSIGYDVPFAVQGAASATLSSASTPRRSSTTCAPPSASRSARSCASTPASTSRATAGRSPSTALRAACRARAIAAAGFGGAFAFDKRAISTRSPWRPTVALNLSPLKNLSVTPQLRLEIFDFRGYQAIGRRLRSRLSPARAARLGRAGRSTMGGGQGGRRRLSSAARSNDVPASRSATPRCCRSTAGTTSSASSSSRPRRCTSRSRASTRTCRTSSCAAHGPAIRRSPTKVRGGVYGGELLVRQELWKGFFGWIAYTLSRSERKDHPDDPWRLFQFDQTHILTIIGSYKFGAAIRSGSASATSPAIRTTPVTGSYYDVNGDVYVPVNGPLYSARLGSFNQLDVRFDKKWTFHRWSLSLYLDLQNLYRAQNPEAYTYNLRFLAARVGLGAAVSARARHPRRLLRFTGMHDSARGQVLVRDENERNGSRRR